MNSAKNRWKVLDKGRFLLAVMEQLAGNAHISFEGNLRSLPLLRIQDASEEETAVLKRNTTWPKQDFVVLPLEPSTVKTILSILGGTPPRSVIHIQVEKTGVLEFGAYDNFDPGCIFFGTSLTGGFVETLVAQGVLGMNQSGN